MLIVNKKRPASAVLGESCFLSSHVVYKRPSTLQVRMAQWSHHRSDGSVDIWGVHQGYEPVTHSNIAACTVDHCYSFSSNGYAGSIQEQFEGK